MAAVNRICLFLSLALPITALALFLGAHRVSAAANCYWEGEAYSPGACIADFTYVCKPGNDIARCGSDGTWTHCLSDCDDLESGK